MRSGETSMPDWPGGGQQEISSSIRAISRTPTDRCEDLNFTTLDDTNNMCAKRMLWMLLRLRRIGRWITYPVFFDEWAGIPHGAIISHPEWLKNPRQASGDVARHFAEVICASALPAEITGRVAVRRRAAAQRARGGCLRRCSCYAG